MEIEELLVKIKEYLDKFHGASFDVEDFFDTFEKIGVSKEDLKYLTYLYMVKFDSLIVKDNNSNSCFKLTKEESRILYFLKKFTFYCNKNEKNHFITKDNIDFFCNIYTEFLSKDLVNDLINKKIVYANMVGTDMYYVFEINWPTEILSSYQFNTALNLIGQKLELEYSKKYFEKFNELSNNISEAEKTIKKLNKENKMLKKKYENSTLYSISTMGIFLAIFSLISINSTSIYEIMKNENLTSKAGLILLINGVLLTGLISLVALIKSLFEVNDNQNIFSKLGGKTIIIPIVLCVVGLCLIG